MLITNDDFLKFREFFYRKTGIFFEESKRYFVDKRLIERMEDTKSDTFRHYFTLLRFEASGRELQTLTNLMTVNETYFFREEYQFRAMVKDILPEIARTKKAGESIKIWSIPSSTGEEPYSIAMTLLEQWSGIDRYDVEIMSSDIDTEVLNSAKNGIYQKRSLTRVPPSYQAKYFTKLNEHDWQISQDLRDAIDFSHVNLTNTVQTRNFKKIDLIFCRNLLIYFDDKSRRMAAEAFYDALNPGGFICLGHSESMSRISNIFRVRRFDDAIVYQKPLLA